MDLLSRINAAYQEYFARTARRPTRIYVGREELIELRDSLGLVYHLYQYGQPRPPRGEVMGLPVYEVYEATHLYVC